MAGGQHPLGIFQEAERRRHEMYAEAERERRARLAQVPVSERPSWLALLAALAIVVGLALQLASGPGGAGESQSLDVAPAVNADITLTPEAELLDPGAARQHEAARL